MSFNYKKEIIIHFFLPPLPLLGLDPPTAFASPPFEASADLEASPPFPGSAGGLGFEEDLFLFCGILFFGGKEKGRCDGFA